MVLTSNYHLLDIELHMNLKQDSIIDFYTCCALYTQNILIIITIYLFNSRVI